MRPLTLTWLVLAAPLAALAAEQREVKSEIQAATVYTDRARIARVGGVELPSGEVELVFDRLPTALIDESVQVSGNGAAPVTILDVTTRVTHVAAAVDPRIESLETTLRQQRRALREVQARLDGVIKQGHLLAKIEDAVASPPTKDQVGAKPSYEDWQKLLTFSADTRATQVAQMQDFTDQKTELEAKIAATEAQLEEINRAAGERSYKTVVVRVAASQAGPLSLNLAYTVFGASWAPQYDARYRPDDRSLGLAYFGIVRQTTGEDWKNVALTLSTARPSLGGEAPELPMWILEAADVRTYGLSMAKASAPLAAARSQLTSGQRQQNFVGAAEGMVELDAFAVQATTAVETSATSASFVVAAKTTVTSDNAPQKVAIAEVRYPTQVVYRTAPKLLEAAFLTASAQNQSDYPLLAGQVNVFLGDTFVATSPLKPVMPGEKFELALGADDAIAVKRKVVSRFKEDTGLTGGGRRVTYDYLITVTNKKKSAERVVIRDVLPVSGNEKIVVRLLSPGEREVGTKEKPKDIMLEEGGKVAWTLDLKAGEKREIPFRFSVDYPGDVPITGLD